MDNRYDEMKNLLSMSRKMLKKDDLTEQRETLIRSGLINEQMETYSDNISKEIEKEIDNETGENKEDKQKTYRVSGGLISLHGKESGDVELTTEDKTAYQETMDEFINEVSELVEFGELKIYPNNVEWSGRIMDFDMEFFYSIGENNGVYINSDMIKLDDNLMEVITKLTTFYDKFKSKWGRIVSSRKKTQIVKPE